MPIIVLLIGQKFIFWINIRICNMIANSKQSVNIWQGSTYIYWISWINYSLISSLIAHQLNANFFFVVTLKTSKDSFVIFVGSLYILRKKRIFYLIIHLLFDFLAGSAWWRQPFTQKWHSSQWIHSTALYWWHQLAKKWNNGKWNSLKWNSKIPKITLITIF